MLATGGTIASAESDTGLVPQMNAEKLLEYVPEVRELAEFTLKNILNLDSSNIQPEEWKIIAREIHNAKHDFDAIVVTHGTDTMSYTASVLTFMLMDISIPVIFTGSQLPISEKNSDGPKNLSDAIRTAISGVGAGVFIVFDGKIILGCRSTKFRSVSFNAFESINAEFVGFIENNRVKLNDKYNKTGSGSGLYSDELDNRVFLLKLIPGTSPDFFRHFVEIGYKGLVIEAFGVGGLHYIRRDLPSEINKLIKSGIEVVVISQCPLELADLTKYEVGKKVEMEGVISGGDMTCEAAVTKLMWALANQSPDKSVKQLMLTNFCGEINESK